MEKKLNIKGLCGWFSLAKEQEDKSPIEAMMAGLPYSAGFTRADGKHASVASHAAWGVHADEDLVVAVTGNPQLPKTRAAASSIAEAIAESYREHGREVLRHLSGKFSLAIWDHSQAKGLIAVDRFSICPLYWCEADDKLVFSTTLDGVLSHPALGRPELSRQDLFNYLFFHVVPSPGTVYENIYKLPAAHAMFIDGGKTTVSCYWLPAFDERADLPIKAAQEELLHLLDTSVAERVKNQNAGAFLSGGLDSSTVTGMLARHSERGGVDTYSIGFEAEGYDEMPYARLVSSHFGSRSHEYYVTPDDVLESLFDIAASYDEPFGNSSALPALFCARMAANDGKSLLLAGDGGDELFAGNARYSRQAVFERYGMLPAWFKKGVLEPLVNGMPGAMPLVQKVRSYIDRANIPLPDRLHGYNYMLRLGASSMLEADFLDAIDTGTPLSLDRELFNRPGDASLLNRMLYLDWQRTLADNDLRKVNRMCELAGIDVEYPMLDDRLVDFSTKISSRRKLQGGRLRDFYKKTVEGFLPDDILTKKKHGFGLPFGVWMASDPKLQQLAGDSLGDFSKRGIIRQDFIAQLLNLHQQSHAAYYGELVWIIVMLELWLSSHA